jgi:hypothetical protein
LAFSLDLFEDEQERDDEAVDGGRLGERYAEKEGSGDLAGSFGLPCDGFGSLAGGDWDAEARAEASEDRDSGPDACCSLNVHDSSYSIASATYIVERNAKTTA